MQTSTRIQYKPNNRDVSLLYRRLITLNMAGMSQQIWNLANPSQGVHLRPIYKLPFTVLQFQTVTQSINNRQYQHHCINTQQAVLESLLISYPMRKHFFQLIFSVFLHLSIISDCPGYIDTL
jgi:hypothetical protein